MLPPSTTIRIGRRVLAECADRSPPPNGGANPRTRVGAARQIVVDLALNKSLDGPRPSSQLPETMLQ